jgi:hypothetical protein
MLIIYEETDFSTINFIKFCINNNYNYVALNIKDLLSDNLSIIDTKDKCRWNIKDVTLNFANINGSYIRSVNFKTDLFKDYKKSDRSYVQKEWWSYLIYRISKIKNCINPITLESISFLNIETPFFLKLAAEIGFNVPKYVFSAYNKELQDIFYEDENKRYIAQFSLIPNNDFRASSSIQESVIGLVEYIKGKPIFVHIIDNDIFSCIYQESEKINIELTTKEKEKCIRICKKTNLRAAQIILIEQEGINKNRFFINLSAYPNWDLNHPHNISKIFCCLYNAISQKQ